MMEGHENTFMLLREYTELAEEAWPSSIASIHLNRILHLTDQLTEILSSETQVVSSPIESNGDAGYSGGVVIEAGENGNLVQIEGLVAPTHPTGSDVVQENSGECLPKNSLPSIRADKKYLNLFDKNATPKERWKIIRQLFRSMDLNGDQYIDEDEFCQAVTSSLRVSRAEALEYFKMVDRNSSGNISLSEFDKYIEVLKINDPRARFMEIAGKDKVMDRKEWKKFCVCNNINPKKREKIWAKMDEDRSGKVTYKEFDIYVSKMLAIEDKDYWFNS